MTRGTGKTSTQTDKKENKEFQEEVLQELKDLKGRITQLSASLSTIQGTVRELELKLTRNNQEEKLNNIENQNGHFYFSFQIYIYIYIYTFPNICDRNCHLRWY